MLCLSWEVERGRSTSYGVAQRCDQRCRMLCKNYEFLIMNYNPPPFSKSLPLLRHHIKLIHCVEHHVARHGVVVGLHPSLCIHVAIHLAELVQNVEGIHSKGYATFEYRLRGTGVPHEVVLVHSGILIAASAVHGYVGAQVYFAGKHHHTRESVVIVIGVDSAERSHVACRA